MNYPKELHLKLAKACREAAETAKPEDYFVYRAEQIRHELIYLELKHGLVKCHTEILPKLRPLCGYQKGKREEVSLYGIMKTCQDCGLEGTIQNGGFIILPKPKNGRKRANVKNNNKSNFRKKGQIGLQGND